MALTRITKGVIKPNENYDTHNINSTGIITAVGANFSGNVSVGGTLTYEDVTSIDSVGVITARDGIHVGAGVSAVGVGTFGGLDISGDIDVDGHTNLDNVSIAGITTTTENIRIQGNNKYLTVGASNQIGVVHTGGEAFIANSSGHFTHRSDVHKWENNAGSSEYLRIESDGQVVINRAAGAVRATSASKLEVFNDTYNTIYVSNSTAAINQEAGIMFAPANNTYGGQIVVKSDEDFSTSANRTAHMAFYTRHNGTAAERLRITSAGTLKFTGQNTSLETAGVTHHTNNNLYIRGGTSGLVLSNHDSTNTIHISNSDFIKFETTDGSEKFKINSIGQLTSTASNNGQIIHYFKNTDTTSGSSAMTVEQHFNFDRTGGGLNLSAARIIAGKEREWVGAASNQDGYFAIHTTKDETSAERLRITSNGNIGINQTSPEYKLVINEENTVGTAHTIIGASLNPMIYLDAGNEVDRSIVIKKHTTANGDEIGGLVFVGSPDATNYSWAGIKAIQDTNSAAESLVFYTSTSNTSGANSNEVVRIKGNSVGIGTNNPATKLHIFDSSADPYLKIGGGGRDCGIQLDAATNFTAFRTDAANRLFVNAGADTIRFTIGGTTTANEKVRITSAGRVGIGTISNWSPYKLQVAGTLGIAESANTGQQAMSIGNNSIQTLSIGVAYNALLLNPSGGDVTINDTTNSVYNDSSGGGINLKANGQIVTKKEATSSADPLIWLNDTGQTTNETIVLAQDGTKKASVGLAGNNLAFFVNGSEKVRILSDGGTKLTRRTVGGQESIGNVNDTWWKIGTWAGTGVDAAARATITVLGANTHNANNPAGGETKIYLSITGTNAYASFYSHTDYHQGVIGVAHKYDSSTSSCEIWVKYSAGYSSTSSFADVTNGYFTGASVNTGSSSTPSGATLATSKFVVRTSDGTSSDERLRIDSNGKFCFGTYTNGYQNNDSVANFVNAASSGVENPLITLWNPTTVNDARAGIDFLTNTGSGTGRDGAFIRASNNGINGKAHLIFGNLKDETYTETFRIASGGCVFANNIGIGTDNRWKIRPNASYGQLAFEYSTSTSLSDSNIKMILNSSGSLILGSTSYGAAGSFSVGQNGTFRNVLASGTAQDTLIGAISGVSNGFQVTTDASNNQTYKFHNGTNQSVVIDSSGDATFANTVSVGGNLIQTLTSPSGTSPFQDSNWYDRDGGHYTLSTTDHNSFTAVRTSSGGAYGNLIYKRVKMSKNCDIEFDLSGNTPSGTYRHVGFTLNADGSNANYDRLVFRYRPGSTSSNQIRIDKANNAGYGFQKNGSYIPNFFDGTERHILIQLRERLVNVIVDGEVIICEKNNADFYNSSGWFGLAIYEGGENAQVTIRNLEIRNKFQIPRWLVRATGVNVNVSSTSVLPYNQIILASSDMNNTSHYNNGSYRFNVPISGLYYVFVRAYRNSSTSNEVAFYVNGSVRNRFRPLPSGGDYIFAGSSLIQLLKGEYIDVRAHNGDFGNFYGNNDQQFSTWGGHLLD